MQREHVGVALDQDHRPGSGRGGARAVDPEQHLPLVVELALGGVEVLRLAGFAHRPRAEAEHAAAGVGRREHDPLAEAVVDLPGPVLRALHEPGAEQLLVAEPGPAGGDQHPVPGAGRVADAELCEGLLAQAAAEQILARVRGLSRLPQVPGVVRGRAAEQRVQPLAALAARRGGRVLVLRSRSSTPKRSASDSSAPLKSSPSVSITKSNASPEAWQPKQW